jgi:outer membrane protein
MDHYAKRYVMALLTLCLFLLPGSTTTALADDIGEPIRQLIDKEFPGAVIKETRQGTLKGQLVTEVELTSQDGTDYEVVISDKGEILHVEEEKGLPLIGGELSLGVALRMERDIYKGVKTEYKAVPFFRYAYDDDRFKIVAYDSIDATFKVIKTDRFAIALRGSLDLNEGYNPDDSDFLKGMDKLDTLYGVGLEIEWNYAGFCAALEALQDISGEHDGQQVELALRYPCNVAGFKIRPELSITWMSDEAVDYFYGVSTAEARADRPAYSPESSYEIEAELLIQRPLFGNFFILGIIGFTMYGSAITDSPIVDKDYGIEGAIGLAYTF